MLRSCSALLLLTATAAFRPAAEKRAFSDLDADNDGQLDDVEIDAHLELTFEREAAAFMEFFDSDGDGQVSKVEYFAKSSSFFQTDSRTPGWFWDSVDRDENGFTDPEELHNERSLVLTATAQELARQWAQKHDVDKDSRISKEEYLSFDGNTETTFTTIDMDEDGFMNTREYLQSAGIGGKPAIWIEHQDTNQDGTVSSGEYYSKHTEL